MYFALAVQSAFVVSFKLGGLLRFMALSSTLGMVADDNGE